MATSTPVRRGAPSAAITAPNGNGAVARQRQQDPSSSLQKLLNDPRVKAEMARALPKHITADRLTRIALTEIRKNPDLAECDQASFLGAVMQAAALGLEPGINGACYLIPYKKTCTFVPGWKGLVDLVSRTGRASVWTGAVHEGDEFDYALGDRPYIKHRPGDETDPDKLIYVYAVGRVNGSDFPILEVWTMGKVWKHRDEYNKQGNRHYSFKNPEMYARKVVLLQVIKYMPSSIELAMVQDLNDQYERGGSQDLPLNQLVAQAPAPVLPGTLSPTTVMEAPGGVASSEDEPTINAQQLKALEGAISRKLSPIGVAALRAELEEQEVMDLSLLPVSSFDPLMRQFGNKPACEAWNSGKASDGRKLLSQDEINEIAQQAAEASAAAAEQAAPAAASVTRAPAAVQGPSADDEAELEAQRQYEEQLEAEQAALM